MKTVIHGGTVCDGSGSAPVRRDILIENGRIAAFALPGEAAGHRWDDLAGYVRELDSVGVSGNTVGLCGHNSPRRRVIGDADRAPTSDELARKRGLLVSALAAGRR